LRHGLRGRPPLSLGGDAESRRTNAMQRLEDEMRELMTEEEMYKMHAETSNIIRSELVRIMTEDTEVEDTLLPALCSRVSVDDSREKRFYYAYNAVVMAHRQQKVESIVIPFVTEEMGPSVVVAMPSLVDELERSLANCVVGYYRELRDAGAQLSKEELYIAGTNERRQALLKKRRELYIAGTNERRKMIQ